MRMQALLVRERILGPAHPDTSYYIRYRGAVYADMGHFERCITLWMYALDMQQKMLEPLSPWCPTSQKATGASTTVTQESKVSQTPSNSVSYPLLDLKTPMTTFRLLCIDLPGHGLSSHIPPGSL